MQELATSLFQVPAIWAKFTVALPLRIPLHLLLLAHWLLHAELLLLRGHHSRLLPGAILELLLLVVAPASTMFGARWVDEGTFYICAAIWRANEVTLATATMTASSASTAATEAASGVLLGLALVLWLDAHSCLLKGRLLLCLHWLSKTLHCYLLI